MHGLYFNNKVQGPANSEVMKERFKDYCFVDIKKCFDVNGWLKYMFKEVKNDERPLCVTYQNKDKGLKYIKKSPSIFSKECRINSFGDITYERNGWISIHQLTSVIDDVEILSTHYLAVIEDIKKSKKSDLKE
jgi:hypothetical protein